jgi:glutamate synthase domain-containing protein 1/glutamate synthase domain-containing protein 3
MQMIESRKRQFTSMPPMITDPVGEGGCGVVGFAASVPVGGRHIFTPSIQMHNRGNGKGGGIAAAGLVPKEMGVDAGTLRDDYLLQIALLDSAVESRVEASHISNNFRIDHREKLKPVCDYRDIGLEVRPPDIIRYFVRVKDDVLDAFAATNGLKDVPRRAVEDEFVYRNSFAINSAYYSSLGEKQAFVLSHARDLMILKIVGYAEQVVQYYGMDDVKAHVWIAHQRYPTKGRVWHPAGAHPFIGMNEALVHNGDFANYYSISEYLRQHNISPQFLTDTEVSVLLYDLLHRTYGYPLEYVIEAMAPTTELDFERLPEEKKKIYRSIQASHMHGSPDGPWFFIIASSDPDKSKIQLMGITDTAMLRPQVFALQEGDVSIGLIASEKQAIDATLRSLMKDDARFRPIADRYWNARGGSSTDGGSFIFTVNGNNGHSTLECADKFGKPIACPKGKWAIDLKTKPAMPKNGGHDVAAEIARSSTSGSHEEVVAFIARYLPAWEINDLRWFVEEIVKVSKSGDKCFKWALDTLALLNDRRYDFGETKRSVALQIIRGGITSILGEVPLVTAKAHGAIQRVDLATRDSLSAPKSAEGILVVYAAEFPMEGTGCMSELLVKAHKLGWKKFAVYGMCGQRFLGCGIGPGSEGVRMDAFGDSGDYLASGIDGMEIHVHDSGQDQLGQILKSGKLVIYGDVGQTFMYGAKGGEVYIMGNAAGRPLINAAGKPRVVINGTCLDYLAESFMAGDPLNGGGFVILNGISFDEKGRVQEQDAPYPGSNLFSLASGGAIYVRDPHRKLVAEQLNGGEFGPVTKRDWDLILPYLQTNEKYFGISIERDLLTVGGTKMSFHEVYRKVHPIKVAKLAKEEVPE